MERVHAVGAVDLARVLGTPDAPFVIDVREPDEVAEWPMPSAVNIPLGELATRIDDVPVDRDVVTVCASGRRSAEAVAMLARAGREAAHLEGGMASWAVVRDTATIDIADVRVVQVRRRGKGCLSYVLGSAGPHAVVVDPGLDVEPYEELAAHQGWRITHVFDTHLHADHLSGARQLAGRTAARLHLNAADPFTFDFVPLHDDETFDLGSGVDLAVGALHTPGHTEGSTVFALGDAALLTGDTLFVDNVGRPDLAGRAEEFARNLHRSLHERILPLGDDTLVLPAHYAETVTVRPDQPLTGSLGEIRTATDSLSMNEEDFVAWAVARTTPHPPNQEAIVKANAGRPELALEELRRLELGPNRCAA